MMSNGGIKSGVNIRQKEHTFHRMKDTTMSLLEHTIWTVLGYGAMPFIFLSGFVAVAVTCCLLLNAFGVQSAEK